MDFKEEILEQFKTLDVTPSDEIIDKCLVLCKNYKLSVENFMEEWMAFVLSNSLNSNPTIESLNLLEKKEFSMQKKTPLKSSILTPKYNSTKKYNDELLDAYETPKIDAVSSEYLTPQKDSYQSTPTPKKHLASKITKISLKEKVIRSFGNQQLLNQAVWFGNDVNIKLVIHDNNTDGDKYSIINNLRKGNNSENRKKKDTFNKVYMYDHAFGQAEIKAVHAKWLASSIIKQNKLDQPVLIDQAIKTSSTVYGRVWEKNSENEKKFFLEGPIDDSSVNSLVPLNLQVVGQNCNLINGQVVVAIATNKIGRDGLEIQPTLIYTEDESYVPKHISFNFESAIQIVIASGPFTASDNFTYSPLERLIQYVVDHRPELVILIGPFIDEESKIVSSGELTETFDDIFDNLVKKIMEPLENINTKVVLVLTYRDVHHQRVYPTASYTNNTPYSNLYFAPDPCQIALNGVVIALTSVDVLKHLELSEISKSRTNERDIIPKLVSYIFSQKCIYPIVSGGLEIPFDFTNWIKYAILHETPHIMVLPSKFPSFIQRVKKSLILNPESLVKDNNSSSFTRIQIHPSKDNQLLLDNVIGEIVHI